MYKILQYSALIVTGRKKWRRLLENDGKFCLQKSADGQLKLKTNHQYYYQV